MLTPNLYPDSASFRAGRRYAPARRSCKSVTVFAAAGMLVIGTLFGSANFPSAAGAGESASILGWKAPAPGELAGLERLGFRVLASTGESATLLGSTALADSLAAVDARASVLKSPALGANVPEALRAMVDVGNGTLTASFNSNGQFTLRRASDGKWLLYPSATTSFFSVKVDASVYSHRDNSLAVSSALTTVNSTTSRVQYTVAGGVDVVQTFVLEGPALGIYTSVSNRTDQPHAVRIRFLLDTQIDVNDGSPLYTQTMGTRTYETEVPPVNVSRWEAWVTPENPQMVGVGALTQVPTRMVFAWWPNAFGHVWDYTPDPSQRFYTPGYVLSPESDGCVLVYYDLGTIAAHTQSSTVVTHYGLGSPAPGGTADQLRAALADLGNTFSSYCDGTVAMYARTTAGAVDRLTNELSVREAAKDITLDLLQGDVEKVIGSFAHRGAIRAGEVALRKIFLTMVKSGTIRIVGGAVADALAQASPEDTPGQIEDRMTAQIMGESGWQYDADRGVRAVEVRLRSRIDALRAHIPNDLQPDPSIAKIITSLRRVTRVLRERTAADAGYPDEDAVFWHVPGQCGFDGNPMNPTYVATAGEANRLLADAIAVYDAEGTVKTVKTWFCVGWAGAGGVMKVVSALTVAGAVPGEGLYWGGIGYCSAIGTGMDFVQLATELAILEAGLETSTETASDIALVRDFIDAVMDDVQAAVDAVVASTNHYPCSTSMSIASASVPDLPLGFTDPIGSGNATVRVANADPSRVGTAQAFLQVFAGNKMIGLFPSSPVNVPAGQAVDLPIPFSVPGSGLFFSSHYIARFEVVTSAGLLERIASFSVCSPLACFIDPTTSVMSGLMLGGETRQVAVATAAGIHDAEFVLSSAGGDFDLHAYDSQNRHVGVNYLTGSTDLGIPGAQYSGRGVNPEWIQVPAGSGQTFQVKTVAVSAEGTTSYSVMAREEQDHPATLIPVPGAIRLTALAGDTARSALVLAEVGGHHAITMGQIRAEDLVGTSGRIEQSRIATSFPSVTVEPGAAMNAGVDVQVPVSLPPGSYRGNLAIEPSNAAAFTVPIEIVVQLHSATFARAEIATTRPNPFGGQVTIIYGLPRSGPVKLAIYDLRGRRLATLVNEVQDAGPQFTTWKGTDERGRAQPPGIYFVRLDVAGERARRTISLVR